MHQRIFTNLAEISLSVSSDNWVHELDDACSSVGYTGDLGDLIDWPSFHRRGMQLIAWLKDEVGTSYRVIYMKPPEDTDYMTGKCSEIAATTLPQ